MLFVCVLFGSMLAYGTELEKSALLTSKADLGDNKGYFVLADGSAWKVVPFEKRWRSVTEWWNGEELDVPECYETGSESWLLGTEIEVFSKTGHYDVNMADASNADTLSQCTHLLHNTRTGKVLFALALEPELFLVNLFKDAHKIGYDKGYKEGHKVGVDQGIKQERDRIEKAQNSAT